MLVLNVGAKRGGNTWQSDVAGTLPTGAAGDFFCRH
jgi:hypothetical protein